MLCFHRKRDSGIRKASHQLTEDVTICDTTSMTNTKSRTNTKSMTKALSRVAEVSGRRKRVAADAARIDRAFKAAVVSARNQGASLRAIRDATGGTVSHEGIRRLLAAVEKGDS